LSNCHLYRPPLDDAVHQDAAMVEQKPGDENGRMVDAFMPPPPLGPPVMRIDGQQKKKIATNEEEEHRHSEWMTLSSSLVDHQTYPAEEIIEQNDADHQNGSAVRTAAGPDAGLDNEPERASSLESILSELLDDDHHFSNKRQRNTSGSSTSTFSTADPTIIRRRKFKFRRQMTNHSFRSSCNIVHQLASRSLMGSSRHHHSGSVMMIRCDHNMMRRDKRWKMASTVRIPTTSSSSSMNAANVLVAFDRDGSLLAVAHGRAELSVYDWQSMRLTTRRRRTNNDVAGSHTAATAADCPPILQFKVGPFSVPIALLAWNPFNEDEIVIGLR
jgi:hypothetical protein